MRSWKLLGLAGGLAGDLDAGLEGDLAEAFARFEVAMGRAQLLLSG